MKTFTALLLAVLVAGVAGCRSEYYRPAAQAPVVQAPFAAPAAPVPVTGPGPATVIVPPPPAAINPPSVNPPVPIPPGPISPSLPSVAPPAPIPATPDIRHFTPQGEPKWQPDPGYTPPKSTAEPPRISVLLLPPEPLTDPKEIAKLKTEKGQTGKLLPPERVDRRDSFAQGNLPVGIPQFTEVQGKDKIAVGLRPSLDEGLDWLQSNGYRTVLLVRLPGEEDQADRKQVEKRGMKFLTVEVSPLTLSKDIVEQFNRIVADKGVLPLFVYDRDGSLAGALWYLHFRSAELQPDDAARLRAGALGLREDRDGSHRDMWLAIQNYLRKQ
jgi:protein tyrosine phosphatase (PTP) superfamily phosphohydrolase (DUF442 family)